MLFRSELSYNEVHALPLLDAVCRETLRLYVALDSLAVAVGAHLVIQRLVTRPLLSSSESAYHVYMVPCLNECHTRLTT